MSVEKTTYGIIGYDLTSCRETIIDEDFYENMEHYEDLICFQTEGQTQLFYDPMCGEHLYFGYIFCELEEDTWDSNLSYFESENMTKITKIVENFAKQHSLYDHIKDKEIKVMIFVEYT